MEIQSESYFYCRSLHWCFRVNNLASTLPSGALVASAVVLGSFGLRIYSCCFQIDKYKPKMVTLPCGEIQVEDDPKRKIWSKILFRTQGVCSPRLHLYGGGAGGSHCDWSDYDRDIHLSTLSSERKYAEVWTCPLCWTLWASRDWESGNLVP